MRAVADLQAAAGASAAVLDPDDDRFMAEYSGVPRSSTALTGAMERLAARRIAQAAQTLDTEIVGRQLAVCRTRVQRLLEDGDLHAYREGRRNRYRSGSSSAANHPLPAWSPNSPPRRAPQSSRGGVGRAGRLPSQGPAEASVEELETLFRADPFAAPDRVELKRLALGHKDLAVAGRWAG